MMRGSLGVISLATLCAMLAAGCGSQSKPSSAGAHPAATGGPEAAKPAAQVLADALAALNKAGAAHVTGFISNDTVNAQVQTDGGSGSLTANSAHLKAVSVAGSTYVDADAAFWESFAGITAKQVAIVSNRWVKLQAGSDVEKAMHLADYASALSVSAATGTVQLMTLQGQHVLLVRQVDGASVYVAATGIPYPVRVVGLGGSASFTLSRFGEHDSLKAPAGALDASK